MPTTFFMLAGEASGDLHGAKLIAELKARRTDARFVGMGGSRMAAAGFEAARDLEGMQVVGFWEVAKKYGFFRRVFHQLLDRVRQERPAALICIDYPGFNLRFAKEVRKLGIPVLYYIVPQVWAWKAMRARSMAGFVDRAYCVFEFEPPFFEKFGLKTRFVGHPLMDCAPPAAARMALPAEARAVALLPGIRAGEAGAIGPALESGMALAQEALGAGRAVGLLSRGREGIQALSGAKADARPAWGAELQRALDAAHAGGAAHAALLPSLADFSMVKSGTSTLEAGLAGKPLCVVYRGSAISYGIAHLLVNIPVFSLINIVLGRYAVPELLQHDVNPQRVAHEIQRGLSDEHYRQRQQAALAELPRKLGGPGASGRAAQAMLDFISGRD